MTESWMNRFFLPCPFKHFTGIDCPGCGFQRSVLALLKGNWLESWHYYPATVPILLLAVFFLLKMKVRFPQAENISKVLWVIAAVTVIVSYAFKISPLF
ncbi:MAG: DUF2752 domain-containing protein [Mucilaginibacter sp.]|uniref:DUF2752 domain-containing protein n=1 Tax=Mucilaginibacter sp. TaxID=1882438 RepID=UPI0034E5824F